MAYIEKTSFEIPGMAILSDLMFDKNRNFMLNGDLANFFNFGKTNAVADLGRSNIAALAEAQKVMMQASSALFTRHLAVAKEEASHSIPSLDAMQATLNDSQTPEVRLSAEMHQLAAKIEKLADHQKEMVDIANRSSSDVADRFTKLMLQNIHFAADMVRKLPLKA